MPCVLQAQLCRIRFALKCANSTQPSKRGGTLYHSPKSLENVQSKSRNHSETCAHAPLITHSEGRSSRQGVPGSWGNTALSQKHKTNISSKYWSQRRHKQFMYSTWVTLRCAVHLSVQCTSVYSVPQCAVYLSVQCISVYSVPQYTVHFSVQCTTMYSALQWAVYLSVQCTSSVCSVVQCAVYLCA